MATSGRFLTTHVGSLPRPDDLIAMMWAREDGIPVDHAAIDVRVRQAVDEAVALQEQAGLDVITDGELRRYAFFRHTTNMPEARLRSGDHPRTVVNRDDLVARYRFVNGIKTFPVALA